MNKGSIEIAATTIRMTVPKPTGELYQRVPINGDTKASALLSFETYLRKTAYKNTTIKINDSFFDDSDMKSEYFLVIIYDHISFTPLLSSRYYFDKIVIAKYLKGDVQSENELMYQGKKFDLYNYSNNGIFLADRLSGNINNSLFRNNRSEIFSTFYAEIVKNKRDCTLLLMVRKDKGDKQLTRYLEMGFILLGCVVHKGKEHNVILYDLKNIRSSDA